MINADLHGIGNRNIMMLCYVYYIRHFRDISRIQSPLRPASPSAHKDGPSDTSVERRNSPSVRMPFPLCRRVGSHSTNACVGCSSGADGRPVVGL